MSYREKYRVSGIGYRSLPSSNRSSIYNLHTTDYNANINEDLTDFDRQFKKLLERTEKFTNRVEKLQSTATYIRRGFRKLDNTVLGLRSSRDAIQNEFDYLDNRYDLDECPSTEEEWRKYVDLGVLIEKAVEILRFRYRCPKPVFEYSPEERSPYSVDITPRPLISPPRSPTDREGRRIRDLGSEIHVKYPSDSKLYESTDEKRKSPLLTKRKTDKFERKLDALTEIEEPRSPIERTEINGLSSSPSKYSKNQINTNFNSSSIFNKSTDTSSTKISIDDEEDESIEGQGKGKRKSFLQTLKNAATKRVGRSSDIKDEKEKRKSRTSYGKVDDNKLDDFTSHGEMSPVKLRSNNQSFKKSYSIDERKKEKSDEMKMDGDKRLKRLSASSSFHEYNPSNRIPLKERLRMKEMAAQKDSNRETEKADDMKSGRPSREKKERSLSSPDKIRRARMKSDSSTTSNDEENYKSAISPPPRRHRSDSNRSVDSSGESKTSKDYENRQSRIHRTLRKAQTVEDEEPQTERLPLRERRKMRMKSEDSETESAPINDSIRKHSVDTMLSKRFSVEDNDDDVTKSPAAVLRSARLQKENQISTSLTNRIQMARQKISRTNEILNTVESDIRNDLNLRESYTLQWEEKQRKMSEERKLHDKKKLERDQPYLYTNERPVKQLMKKHKHSTSDLMEKLQKITKEVEEDRVVPTKHRCKENFVIEFVTPHSSVESIPEIEDLLEMSLKSDESINDTLFASLDQIEPPKYPSDDEFVATNLESPHKIEETDFDRAFEFTLLEIEREKQKQIEAEEKAKQKTQVEKEEGNGTETNNSAAVDSVSPTTEIQEALGEKESDSTEPTNDNEKSVPPAQVHSSTTANDTEKERKSSVTVSINLSSPNNSKKEFVYQEKSDANQNDETKINVNDETPSEDEKVMQSSNKETKEDLESNTEIPSTKPLAEEIEDSNTNLPKTGTVSNAVDKKLNITVRNALSTNEKLITTVTIKDSSINDNLKQQQAVESERSLLKKSELPQTEDRQEKASSFEERYEAKELPRPQSSMDLLLEELDEMNRELFEDIENMQKTSRKSSYANLYQNGDRATNNKIFTVSHSFDNLEDAKNSNGYDRPASVCSGSPFTLSTPVTLSQENLNVSKSSPDITRGSSDSLFTISKINKSDNNLQTFAQFKEWNSKEDISNIDQPATLDENNNKTSGKDTAQRIIKLKSEVSNDSPELPKRSESSSSLSSLGLSRSSLSDSSEVLYLKDSSQIKMSYREKREAHLKLLQRKRAESDSIPESDEVFSKALEHSEDSETQTEENQKGLNNDTLEDKSIEISEGISSMSVTVQNKLEIKNEETQAVNQLEHSPSIKLHIDIQTLKKEKEALSSDNVSKMHDQTENLQHSKQIGKSASIDTSTPDLSRQQNKARTYYRKVKSTSDSKRKDFKDQRIYSKSVEHY